LPTTPVSKPHLSIEDTDKIVDGLRIDTVKHVEKDFWPGYNDAAGVYCVGEVASGDPVYTCPYQNYLDGVLNYPMYAV
jgi:alpha-amylase